MASGTEKGSVSSPLPSVHVVWNIFLSSWCWWALSCLLHWYTFWNVYFWLMWELNLDWRHRNPVQHLVYLDSFPGHLVFDFCPFARSTDGVAKASVQPEPDCSRCQLEKGAGQGPGWDLPCRMTWVMAFCDETLQSIGRNVPRTVKEKHQCYCRG